MLAKRQQSGFALLIFLMILIGMGAFVVEGYMQNIAKEVQQKQYHKNQIILEEAKAALLQYAYNYAEITRNDVNPKGPGRLPCADTDNDGQSNTAFGACTSIGRFPWAEPNLNTSDLRTTSGERLWYAVSTGFATNVPGGIDVNSDSTGTITIKDQSGNVIYDGNGAGVAAIIIAPGPPINRAGTPQDRSVSNADDPFDSTADTDPGIINASAYLDLIGTQDNATLTHGDSDDGFIIGSIGNSASSLIVNDQMIFITADEVIAMAEKAVLQAYKNAIEEYLANTGGVYPRLFNYVTNNLESFTSGVTNIGRIPSIFSNYFTSADSVPIDSEILVSVTKTFDLQGVTYNLSLVQQSANILTNVRFDNSSRLRADAVAEKMERNIYFWDDLASPSGVWALCGAGADDLVDCNRNAGGVLTPGSGSNLKDSKILKVSISIDLSTSISFDLDYSAPINTQYFPATPSSHAIILRTFSADKVTEPSFLFSVQEAEYDTGMVYNDTSNDDQDVNDNNNMGLLVNQSTSVIKIGMRYYPELPEWAAESENKWYRSIRMAISPSYMPGGSLSCSSLTCLTVPDMGGITNNKIALLINAGSSNIFDDNLGPTPPAVAGFSDELQDIFDPGNDDSDLLFFNKAGDDTILILQEQ